MTDTVVVIYSGGMDSFTLLHRALARGLRVHALSFDYGQRHVRELACARQVCQALAIPHKVLDIRAMSEVMSGSSLTSDIDVPEGHYEEESMKATVVPNRNMILLSLPPVTPSPSVPRRSGTAPMVAIMPSIRTAGPNSWRRWMRSAVSPTMSR
jgi:7-cyano-7-deazaguanine synthase in queuosine biosynthesis